MKKGSTIIVALASLTIALSALIMLLPNLEIGDSSISLGSVVTGSEYNSTTTSATFPDNNVLKLGSGSLGSVIITGTSPGSVTVYDATSTDDLSRVLANFQTTATPGTYTFDSVFSLGLLVASTDGTGSTTITWR